MKINFALFEDHEATHFALREFFDFLQQPNATRHLRPAISNMLSPHELAVAETLSQRVTPENSEEILAAVRAYKGPLIMLLDIDMYSSGPAARDRATKAYQDFAAKLRGGRGRLRSAVATEVEDKLNKIDQGLAIGNLAVDGLEFGLAAIENMKIEPLVIVIATRSRAGSLFTASLNAYTFLVRENNALCRTIEPTYASAEELTRSDERMQQGLSQHIAKAVEEFVMMGHSKDPRVRVRTHLADQVEHPHAEDLEYVKSGLMALLAMPEEEFNENLWPSLKRHALELWKCSGICRTHLGVIAGWFYALMMYLHMDGDRPWEDIFKPKELDKFRSDLYYQITPTLPIGHAPGTSLQKAVDRYLDMCEHLFRNESEEKAQPGPLRKISISNDDLSFYLRFDAWKADKQADGGTGTAGNLVEKMARWRDSYLDPKQANNGMQHKSEQHAHPTAKAMVDWLFTCVMDAPGHSKNTGVLMEDVVWKMELSKSKGGTQVCFKRPASMQVVSGE